MGQSAYIRSIAYELPEKIEANENGRLTRKTGIYRRHIAGQKETASDLAARAVERLFERGVNRDTVDFLLLCTQSPDYILPTTACLLQQRLRLPKHIGALDFNLGCSGYVYGLSLAKGLIETGQAKRVLLATAETYSKYIHPQDEAVRPLFGDAAAATLVEAVAGEESGITACVFGTDGGGGDRLIVPMGAGRNPYREDRIEEEKDDYGNIRTNANLRMDGAAIGAFALERVPEALRQVLKQGGIEKEAADYYVFHQANRFILDYLRKKCGLDNCRYWNDVRNYGNTVSNSIPIALADMMEETATDSLKRVVLMGFGVGLSWAGCIVDLTRCCR